MSNGSSVTLIGNITADPVLRKTGGGSSVTQFSIAVSRRWKNRDNEWEEDTNYFDVVAWSELADNLSTSLRKGNRIIATGRLEQQEWEKNGEKRSKIVLIADDIGASLRRATINGLTKSGQTDGRYQKPEGGSSQYQNKGKQDSYFDDEEPF